MARISLTRLCMQEGDRELKEVRCKHGFILSLLTSLTPRNLDEKYWGCPYYGNAITSDFWLWKDDYIDPRSRFVISNLLERIDELEQRVEVLEKINNKSTRSTNSVKIKIDMNKIESKLDNFDDDLKKMKLIEKK
ncbi:uncharacterized protein LOC129896281 [Solanum dulcamara]|uniref:uncharacterized protein LOC129896281 n=1 Tax=Solanum dulcamara TaxID=45834 RepID=UPI0024852374|nr:uncharacterized protein LOC129896281 [Solanum dulcamara]